MNKAFDKIAAGLNEAIDLARAERLIGIPAATLAGLRSGKLVAVPRPWRAERGSEGFSMNIRHGVVTDYWSANFAFTSRRQRDQVLAIIAAAPAPKRALSAAQTELDPA